MYSEFKTSEWEKYFLELKQKVNASENDVLLAYIREVVLSREDSYLHGINIEKLNKQKESENNNEIIERVVEEALAKHEEAFMGRVVEGLSVSLNTNSVSVDYELISDKVVEKLKASIPKRKETQLKVEPSGKKIAQEPSIKKRSTKKKQDKSFWGRLRKGWTAFSQGV